MFNVIISNTLRLQMFSKGHVWEIACIFIFSTNSVEFILDTYKIENCFLVLLSRRTNLLGNYFCKTFGKPVFLKRRILFLINND